MSSWVLCAPIFGRDWVAIQENGFFIAETFQHETPTRPKASISLTNCDVLWEIDLRVRKIPWKSWMSWASSRRSAALSGRVKHGSGRCMKLRCHTGRWCLRCPQAVLTVSGSELFRELQDFLLDPSWVAAMCVRGSISVVVARRRWLWWIIWRRTLCHSRFNSFCGSTYNEFEISFVLSWMFTRKYCSKCSILMVGSCSGPPLKSEIIVLIEFVTLINTNSPVDIVVHHNLIPQFFRGLPLLIEKLREMRIETFDLFNDEFRCFPKLLIAHFIAIEVDCLHFWFVTWIWHDFCADPIKILNLYHHTKYSLVYIDHWAKSEQIRQWRRLCV